MLAKKLLEAAGNATLPTYIEDVFSTYLYTGNGSTQTITNGIDLAGKGGLVWTKDRVTAGFGNELTDTVRGAGLRLISNTTGAQGGAGSSDTTGFTSSGFELTFNNGLGNLTNEKYVSWTFRKQPKFFDVVTYTGNGTNNRAIAHNLGSAPGCVIVKSTSNSQNWPVYHRSTGANTIFWLNATNANSASTGYFPTAPDATSFYVGTDTDVNQSGYTYVAYVFAHDAGGFGLTGTDNVISCGSFTTDGSGNATVSLGYEPQWVLIKSSSNADGWQMVDTMRGMAVSNGLYNGDQVLQSQASSAETSGAFVQPSATGFDITFYGSSRTYIYIAIRRGPMKVPTSGTSVFAPSAVSSDTTPITTNFPVDSFWEAVRAGNGLNTQVAARLIGQNTLTTTSSSAEAAYAGSTWSQSNTSYTPNIFGSSAICYAFGRAPSFFDEVCYTGTGSATTVTHNLGVTPELMIVKSRSGTGNWKVWNKSSLYTNLWLNSDAATQSDSVNSPTTTTFAVFNDSNTSGVTYVAHLFATCAGVSKVGSYTGNGSTQTINCGFTSGARFVLIKRTDSTGDWYVWDSARGIVSGNDPYLLLNSTAAETTGTDYIDPYSAGFEISSTAPAAINASGGTFIFLAIA